MTAAESSLSARPVRLDVPPAELGESPCWVSEALYWLDIPACRVHRLGSGGRHVSWDVGQPVSAIALRSAGGLALAGGDGFYAFDLAEGTVTELAAVGHGQPGIRMNDGACDRAGRFYAGSMAEDESPGVGALYRLDPDRSVTRLLTEVGISNGIGWSPDDDRMYYADSLAYRVDIFDYEPATGAISERRPLTGVGEGEIMPDGLAVDAEGGVWIALWGGGAVHRYSPDGELTQVIELPAANVTCCAFGGRDLATLYITTAAGPGEFGGALFSCRPGAIGLPANPYCGLRRPFRGEVYRTDNHVALMAALSGFLGATAGRQPSWVLIMTPASAPGSLGVGGERVFLERRQLGG